MSDTTRKSRPWSIGDKLSEAPAWVSMALTVVGSLFTLVQGAVVYVGLGLWSRLDDMNERLARVETRQEFNRELSARFDAFRDEVLNRIREIEQERR